MWCKKETCSFVYCYVSLIVYKRNLCLVWFLCLIAYQPLWVIQCQSHPCKTVLFKSELRVIKGFIPFPRVLIWSFKVSNWLSGFMAYQPWWVIRCQSHPCKTVLFNSQLEVIKCFIPFPRVLIRSLKVSNWLIGFIAYQPL